MQTFIYLGLVFLDEKKKSTKQMLINIHLLTVLKCFPFLNQECKPSVNIRSQVIVDLDRYIMGKM